MSLLFHLDKLTMFSTVAEAGSLGAAARRLSVSQPALTQSMNTLERATGCQLIIRSREGVELTASGRLLYQSAIRILREAAVVESALTERHSETKRSLRVGIIESIAIYAWPGTQVRLRSLFETHGTPGTNFDLMTGRTDDLLKRLSAGDLDIGVVIDPSVGPLFVREPLYQDSFYLYCSPEDTDRRHLEKPATNNDDVRASSRPLFLFESARIASGETLRAILPSLPVQFSNVNRVDSFEVASEFVRTGLGFALLPERVAKKHREGLHQLKPGGHRQQAQATHAVFACAPQTIALTLPFKLLCQAMRDTRL